MKSNVLSMTPRQQANPQGETAGDKQSVKKQPAKKQQPLALRIAVMGLMVYAGIAVVSFGQQVFQLQGINQNIDQIQQDITTMRQKNQQLSMEIKRLQSDAYIERVAREQLGLVKPGETVLLKAEISSEKPVPKGTQVDTRE